MRLVYPRPDSETNSYARHHRAYYDGTNAVEYDICIGVTFGAFPYVFELQSGPPGMTIEATTWNTAWGPGLDAHNGGYGRIKWTPSAAIAPPATYPPATPNVKILVTDQQHNTLTIEFSVWTEGAYSATGGANGGPGGFIFVDNVSGNDTNAGTIAAPLASLGNTGGIVTGLSITTQPGGTLTDGVYNCVGLTSTTTPKVFADVTVSGGAVTTVTVFDGGAGHSNGDVMTLPYNDYFFKNSGATSNGTVTVTSVSAAATNLGAYGGSYATAGTMSQYPQAGLYVRNTGSVQYTVPQFPDNSSGQSNALFEINTATAPSFVLGWPADPAPVIDVTLPQEHCIFLNSGALDLYIKGISANGYTTNTQLAGYKLVYVGGKISTGYRQTFDGMTWTNSGYGALGTDNACMIYSSGGSPSTPYVFVTGCSDQNRQSGFPGNNFAGADFYSLTDVLVQYCDATSTGDVDAAWYLKSDIEYGTVRGCKADFARCNYAFSYTQSVVSGEIEGNNESCFNLGIYVGEIYAPAVSGQGPLWIFRNSLFSTNGVGLVCNGAGAGPFVFTANAINTSYTPVPNGSGTFVSTNNLVGSGVLNSDGTLVNSANLGLIGAWIA